MPIGVLVMAYGTASGPDDIERYYTDIRGGRTPGPEHLAELKDRYAAIGNVFPLLDTTRAQAEGLVERLNADADGMTYRAYLGMKHSDPFIPEGLRRMREDGVRQGVGIVMAPHWSGMSIETYIDRVQQDVDANGGPNFTFVREYGSHPAFVRFLAGRLREALDALDPATRTNTAVIFSAHSLPVRTLEDGTKRCLRCDCETACRYDGGLRATADLVAAELGGLPSYTTAWQSAGRTADPWWGPPVEDVILSEVKDGRDAVVVCSAGFVADHLEVLFDLDIEAKQLAEDAGIAFSRTRMPNADPEYLDVLATVVRDELAGAGG
ncbi:MAG: protoporphyrin/coproporphyrin ferrochelatase [Actinomycetota bacterium]|jgi:ferrochelatase|nr:protoporphyrin/coproporphyrin ferrochelatase [Actinomycetota bacterium]